MTRLVFAYANDDEAARLARELGARLVTPRALSQRGWHHFPVGGGVDQLALDDGELVPASAITGVISRIAGVSGAELPHIAAQDRDYTAAEMTAFLLSLLGSLADRGCPVINRPTPLSLMGPGWSAPRWRAAATSVGFVCAPAGAVPSPRIAIAIGERCVGARDRAVERNVVALARAANTELLGVVVAFDGAFIAVEPWAHWPPEVLAAVAARLGAVA